MSMMRQHAASLGRLHATAPQGGVVLGADDAKPRAGANTKARGETAQREREHERARAGAARHARRVVANVELGRVARRVEDARVEDDGHRAAWIDAATDGVEVELACAFGRGSRDTTRGRVRLLGASGSRRSFARPTAAASSRVWARWVEPSRGFERRSATVVSTEHSVSTRQVQQSTSPIGR